MHSPLPLEGITTYLSPSYLPISSPNPASNRSTGRSRNVVLFNGSCFNFSLYELLHKYSYWATSRECVNVIEEARGKLTSFVSNGTPVDCSRFNLDCIFGGSSHKLCCCTYSFRRCERGCSRLDLYDFDQLFGFRNDSRRKSHFPSVSDGNPRS